MKKVDFEKGFEGVPGDISKQQQGRKFERAEDLWMAESGRAGKVDLTSQSVVG